MHGQRPAFPQRGPAEAAADQFKERYPAAAEAVRAWSAAKAPLEASFFASPKVERLHQRRYATTEELRADVADYIERFHNRQRRHSTLGYLSPALYQLRHAP